MPVIAKNLCDFFGQSYDGEYENKIIFDAIFADGKKGKPKTICKRIGFCTNKEISTYIKNCKYYKENRYMTANGFFADRRKEKYLSALYNLVIDVDAHSAPLEQINDLVEDFLYYFYRDLVNFGELPAPSLVSKTGRGVQLWFSLKQCYAAKFTVSYKRVAKAFVLKIQNLLDEYPNALKHLEVDSSASGNPAGLYRIPGSYNVKTESFGSYEIYGHKYDLVELYEEFVKQVDITPNNRKVVLKDSAPEFHGKDLPKGKYSLTHMRRMALIEGLIADRRKEAGSETRNLLLLYHYNAAVQIMSRADARQKLMKLNQKFKEPLTGYKRIIDYIDAVKNYYGQEGYLPITNVALIDKLSLTKEEQEKYKIGQHNGQAPKQNEARDTKRRLNKKQRDDMIYMLAEKGISAKDIAIKVGCHRDTVSKVLNLTEKNAIAKADIAQKIHALKKEKMTQRKVAETLGVPLITVRRMW